jgi:L-threonylcarbamoyladenylate synthase
MVWIRELVHLTPRQEHVLSGIWPGSVTAVLNRKQIIPQIVTAGNPTVAVRIPDYPLLDKLLEMYGYPLTMTSANVSGEESSQKISDILAMFRDTPFKPDLVVDVGTLPPSQPSTLVDLTSEHPKILRVGATNPQQLMELLKL